MIIMETGQHLIVDWQNKLKYILTSAGYEKYWPEINDILQSLDSQRKEKLMNFLSVSEGVIGGFKSADLSTVLNVFKKLNFNYRIGLIDVLNNGDNGKQLNLYEQGDLINVLDRLDETDKCNLINVLYQSSLDKKKEYISQLNRIGNEQSKVKESINSINVGFYKTQQESKEMQRPIQLVNQNNSQSKNENYKKQQPQTNR
jgi:hypothetical protein